MIFLPTSQPLRAGIENVYAWKFAFLKIFIFQEALILKKNCSSDRALRTPPTLAVTFGLFQADKEVIGSKAGSIPFPHFSSLFNKLVITQVTETSKRQMHQL